MQNATLVKQNMHRWLERFFFKNDQVKFYIIRNTDVWSAHIIFVRADILAFELINSLNKLRHKV